MFRTVLIVGVLLASLPAALCEAACTPRASAAIHAGSDTPMPMPCHAAPPAEVPAAPPGEHDDSCAACQVELAVASTSAHALDAGAAFAPTLALQTALPVVPSRTVVAGTFRHPPDRLLSPYRHTNAPLLR